MDNRRYLTSREDVLVHLGASGALPKLEEMLWNLLHKGHDFDTIKTALLDTVNDQADAVRILYVERTENFAQRLQSPFFAQQEESL